MARSLDALKLVAAGAFVAMCTLTTAGASAQSAMPVVPALPATPSATVGVKIISIQGVVLGSSYATDFRSEHPQVIAGWLMVIEADKAVLAPRSLAEPLVLASGTRSADGKVWTESVEWFNHGFASGHRVCFIPSPLNEQGVLTNELKGVRVWFGTPRLPESVDAAALEQERALADGASVAPTVVATASPTIHLADRDALISSARELIARFAPDEVQPDAAAPVAPAVPALR